VSDVRAKKACCMVSELLEEAGLDRDRLRDARRQVLQGIVMLCQWQLQRMETAEPKARGPKARKVHID
jgi:hypothetical protein